LPLPEWMAVKRKCDRFFLIEGILCLTPLRDFWIGCGI